MRPLVWWVQDHLGFTAIGLLGAAAVAVAVILVSSGGSSEDASGSAGKVRQPAKVAASPASTDGHAASGKAAEGGSTATAGTGRRRAGAAAHHRHAGSYHAAEATHTSGAANPATAGKVPAAGTEPGGQQQQQQPGTGAKPSLGKAAADQVAAAHPGVECPKSYSRKQCEQAVQAAAEPAPSTKVSQPSDCGKAMSEAQCEELFAAEAAAKAAGGGSISPQECMEHPEEEKCAAVVEQMKAQYEAAHPGG